MLGLNGQQVGLYRLPKLLAAPKERTVYVVEGEKDVHACEARELLATCNAGGAGKFRPDHAEVLVGRPVVIVMDKDEAGQGHALQVAKLLEGKAASVQIVQGKTGKDAHDHFAAGHLVSDFEPVDPSQLEAEVLAKTPSDEAPNPGQKEEQSPVAVLEALLEKLSAELWKDESRQALLTLKLDGKLRHAEVGSSSCDDLLRRIYYREKKKALPEQALAAATGQLRVEALYDGPTLRVDPHPRRGLPGSFRSRIGSPAPARTAARRRAREAPF